MTPWLIPKGILESSATSGGLIGNKSGGCGAAAFASLGLSGAPVAFSLK